MATAMNSFDSSPLGAFVKSPLGVRGLALRGFNLYILTGQSLVKWSESGDVLWSRSHINDNAGRNFTVSSSGDVFDCGQRTIGGLHPSSIRIDRITANGSTIYTNTNVAQLLGCFTVAATSTNRAVSGYTSAYRLTDAGLLLNRMSPVGGFTACLVDSTDFVFINSGNPLYGFSDYSGTGTQTPNFAKTHTNGGFSVCKNQSGIVGAYVMRGTSPSTREIFKYDQSGAIVQSLLTASDTGFGIDFELNDPLYFANQNYVLLCAHRKPLTNPLQRVLLIYNSTTGNLLTTLDLTFTPTTACIDSENNIYLSTSLGAIHRLLFSENWLVDDTLIGPNGAILNLDKMISWN